MTTKIKGDNTMMRMSNAKNDSKVKYPELNFQPLTLL